MSRIVVGQRPVAELYNRKDFTLANCPEELKGLFSNLSAQDGARRESLNLTDVKLSQEWVWWLCYCGLPRCRKLETLILTNCGIGNEGVKHLSREGLQHCKHLTYLGLANNNITADGMKYFCQKGLQHCPLLRDLWLYGNPFGDVGMKHLCREGLAHTPLLTCLQLPRYESDSVGAREFCLHGVKHCRALQVVASIDLKNFTTQLGIPIEFREKNNRTILTYLRQQGRDGSVNVNRVKVMLVGPGEVGKTTLAHKLMTNQFAAGQFTMTDGVVMHDWKHGTVDFQLWDFGGQEVYFNTHAMFFEDRSVYLIMWNARQLSASQVLKTLDEYFQTVQNRAPQAPILLVSTHADELPAMAADSLAEVRAKYPTVLGYHHVDSHSGKGIEDLKAKLVAAALQQPYVAQSIPTKYVQVEDRLKALRDQRKFSISKTEYLDVVKAAKLDTEQADLLLSLLHQWGVVHVLPGGDIVLQPQQLADVMKCVVTKTPAGESITKGILNHRDIGRIWSQFEARLHLQFLKLFHQCELAYPLYDSSGAAMAQSLVPAMLLHPQISHDDMSLQFYPDFEESAHKYGKIKLTFNARAMTFFPKLQARLRAMATRNGAFKQFYFVNIEDSITGDLSSALLCHEPSSGKIELRYPLSSDQACAAALRAIRYLLDEEFATMCITEVQLLVGTTVLKKASILKRLQADRNALLCSEDDEGNPCKASLAPIRVLFKELDTCLIADPVFPTPPAVNIAPTPMPAPAPAIVRPDPTPVVVRPVVTPAVVPPAAPVPTPARAPAPVPGFFAAAQFPSQSSELQELLNRVRQITSTPTDLTDLSIHIIKTIPDISRRCGVNKFHVSVIWLAMVDRASGRTFLVPISPSRSVAEPWAAVFEARVECRPASGSASLDLDDAPAAALLLEALFEVGVPRGLQHLGGQCEWRGLVKMAACEGALLTNQAEHFEKSRTAEGVEVLMRKKVVINKMPTVVECKAQKESQMARELASLHAKVDRVAAVQMDGVYKVHDMPLLMCVTSRGATGVTGFFRRMYAHVFQVHFICPVCAQKSGHGYKLTRTKEEVAIVAKYTRYALKAIEIISLLTPVPLPHLSDLGKYMPSSDLIAELGLAEALEATQRRVTENLARVNGRRAPPAQQEVVMTLADVNLLKAMLPIMGETFPPVSTGLHPVFYRSEQCAWVCQEAHSQCGKRFKDQGNACLQIKVTK